NEDGEYVVSPSVRVTLLALTTGEELCTSGAWYGFTSALASATVSPVLAAALAPAPPPPPRKNSPPSEGVPLTSSTFEPSASIWFVTAVEEPVPTAISTITEPT